MNGFIIFVCVLAGIYWLARYLRQREVEAFLDADLSVLQDMKTDALKVDLPAVATAVPDNVVSLANRTMAAAGPEDSFTLREALLDELHREFLQKLETVLAGRYRVFVQVPLTDFVRSPGDARLLGRHVSFLCCHPATFAVAFGIALKGAGPTEASRHSFLETVFRGINRPLLSFPLVPNVSLREIEQGIGTALPDSPIARACPRCGKSMAMRKAARGPNAGKSFWVCREFPSCRGITRIGSR